MNDNTITLTLNQLKELLAQSSPQPQDPSSPLIGKYVIVRCRDAGVHAGILEAAWGRTAILRESRRLWYWKSLKSSFLSGVACDGLDATSKVGAPIRVQLTETCEIIETSAEAERTIREAKTHETG